MKKNTAQPKCHTRTDVVGMVKSTVKRNGHLRITPMTLAFAKSRIESTKKGVFA